MPSISRRRFVGGSLGALGAAGVVNALPDSVQKAVAEASDRPGSPSQIEHVIVFMQENRSFDTYFGTLRGVRGFNDPTAITLPTGRPVWYQPDPQVSWIIGTNASTEHPPYLPAAGATVISELLDALASNPKVFNRSVFFLPYDENDGYFDHVPPPTAPEGTPGEWLTTQPCRPTRPCRRRSRAPARPSRSRHTADPAGGMIGA